MSESSDRDRTFEQENIELLIVNSESILEQQNEIKTVFEKTVGSDLIFNNFDIFFRYLQGCLYGKVEEDDADDIAEALLNIVNTFTPEAADELRESGEEGEKLFEFITELEVEYGTALSRRTNRLYKGQDWWSNIKTKPGYRSGRPHFTHEIIKDYSERVLIETDPQNTLVLARHLISEVESARDTLGEDILDYINPQLVGDINDLAEELEDAMEEYNSESEEPEENTE